MIVAAPGGYQSIRPGPSQHFHRVTWLRSSIDPLLAGVIGSEKLQGFQILGVYLAYYPHFFSDIA
jgi:hypothetical protein